MSEVKELVKSGVYNITLSGDSIADYGVDFRSNIIRLLNYIGSVDKNVSFNLLDFSKISVNVYTDLEGSISNSMTNKVSKKIL